MESRLAALFRRKAELAENASRLAWQAYKYGKPGEKVPAEIEAQCLDCNRRLEELIVEIQRELEIQRKPENERKDRP